MDNPVPQTTIQLICSQYLPEYLIAPCLKDRTVSFILSPIHLSVPAAGAVFKIADIWNTQEHIAIGIDRPICKYTGTTSEHFGRVYNTWQAINLGCPENCSDSNIKMAIS